MVFYFSPLFFNEIAQELLPACLVSATNLESISSRESFISEEKTTELRSIYNAHMLDSNFQALIHHPYFVSIARQILGFNVYIHQSHINYKKAFSGENFFWHQDFTFWRDEDGMPSPRAIGIIVFLDEVRPENGPIMYIAGSPTITQLSNSLANYRLMRVPDTTTLPILKIMV